MDDVSAEFPVLGLVHKKDRKPITILPAWIKQSTSITSNISVHKIALKEFLDRCPLPPAMVVWLGNKFSHLFPVQADTIPLLVNEFLAMPRFRPRDVCISAPTGSGKTLCYLVPVVSYLLQHSSATKTSHNLQVLVMLPSIALAQQVFDVLRDCIENTSLKVVLLTGQKSFDDERKSLVANCPGFNGHHGYRSLVDIVVATPGRLLDHLRHSEPYLRLQSLRYLVIDEADKMMHDLKLDWITEVESAVYSVEAGTTAPVRPKPSNVLSLDNCLLSKHRPLQKILVSATLSMDPERLQMLGLFQPRLFTVKTAPTDESWRSVLCFCATNKSAFRLHKLLDILGVRNSALFTAEVKSYLRDKALADFAAKKVRILVCSDIMSRGMDFSVDVVLNYDFARTYQAYIHRAGRTARAGANGSVVTLVSPSETVEFHKMIAENKNGSEADLNLIEYDKPEIKLMFKKYKRALKQLGQELNTKVKKRRPKKRLPVLKK